MTSHYCDNHAIVLRDVCKSYSFAKMDFPVLKKLNLTVPQGTIYALLGPSGCGKTTILRCIIGQLSVDEGSMLVLGAPPVRSFDFKQKIGYMPQDTSLCEDLTSAETLRLFGTIAGMSAKQIRERSKFLIEFLHISYYKKQIRNLSGGQKRRVSLAVALIHEPALLLLDEPTVGVDPPLRKSIWSHLFTLANVRNMTIIITTHHIEEAHMANTVGLLLNGCLVAEDPPDVLLRTYNCPTLEKVYLKLFITQSKKDEEQVELHATNNKMLKSSEVHEPHNEGTENQNEMCSNQTETLNCNEKLLKSTPQESHLHTDAKGIQSNGKATRRNNYSLEVPNLRRIYVLFLKHICLLTRNPALLGMEFIIPPIIIALCQLLIGKPLTGLRIGVINQDLKEFGTLYSNSLSNATFIKVLYHNYEVAFEDALLGKICGVININANFTDAVVNRYNFSGLPDDASLELSSIGIALDFSNLHIAYAVNVELWSGYQKFLKVAFPRMGLNPILGNVPIQLKHTKNYRDEAIPYDEFLMPALISKITFSLAMAMTSLLLVNDKHSGSLERMFIGGVTFLDIVMSQLLMQSSIMIVQVVSSFILVYGIFKMPCLGSYLLAVLLTALQGMCGMSAGILISVFCEVETSVIAVNMALFFFGICLSGFLWPTYSWKFSSQYINMIWPETIAYEGLRSIVFYGWDFTYPIVLAGFLTSIGWVIFLIMVASIFACFK